MILLNLARHVLLVHAALRADPPSKGSVGVVLSGNVAFIMGEVTLWQRGEHREKEKYILEPEQ